MKLKTILLGLGLMGAGMVAAVGCEGPLGDSEETDQDEQALDQCNTTSQCKSLFGNTATDCLNSQSANSVCMCGAVACSGGSTSAVTTGGGSVDECNTTSQCKSQYGSSATDCLNSQSAHSVCMCGSAACADGDPEPSAGRIAISADGNFHDRDDIGATPVSLALIARAGLQSSLVHYDHSNHLLQNDSDQYGDMITSATGRLSQFGFNSNIMFDDQTQLAAAVASIASAVNGSSSSDRLYFIVAGPFEVAYRGIAAASASKRQYVTIISHSNWNEDHQHVAAEHTKDELLAAFPSVAFTRISDQNSNAFKSPVSAWDWMNSAGSNLAWVRGRMPQAEYAAGDNSDAGMVFWLLTGNEHATMAQIKSFFGQ